MKPLFIIGYMGCGKTTFGRALSQATGLRFIDLDLYIEERFRKTVRQIFDDKGEGEFRAIEKEMLHKAGEMSDCIVSCGGGTPCFFDNMEWMNAHGTTVFLDTSIDKLHKRLMRGRHKRPLIAGKSDEELLQFIRSALAERMPHYSKASMTFVADLLDSECEKSETARRFISQLNLTVS